MAGKVRTAAYIPDELLASNDVFVEFVPKNGVTGATTVVLNLCGSISARPAHTGGSKDTFKTQAKEYTTYTRAKSYENIAFPMVYTSALYTYFDEIKMQTGNWANQAGADGTLNIYEGESETPAFTHAVQVDGVTEAPTGDAGGQIQSMSVTFAFVDAAAD